MEDLMTESGLDGNSIMSSYPNMSHSLDNRYGLCNHSRYASLPFCANKSGGEEFRPDYSHGFAMQRIISIVVCSLLREIVQSLAYNLIIELFILGPHYIWYNCCGWIHRKCSGCGGGCRQSANAQHDQPAHYKSSFGRSIVYRLLRSVHRLRLRFTLLAVWRRLVQNCSVSGYRDCLRQCLHSRLDVA